MARTLSSRTRRNDGRADPTGKLLTRSEVVERLNSTDRFVRRLVEERRITIVKVGREVRIPETALENYISSHTIEAREVIR